MSTAPRDRRRQLPRAGAPGAEAADPLTDYVARVRARLGQAAPALEEDLAELAASLREAAADRGQEAALAAHGPADRYADALIGTAGDQADEPSGRPCQPVRRVLGVPVALSPRGLSERAARSFSPADPVLVPRAYGIGWDLNLGALAVRAGLAHPDDLDDDLSLGPAQTAALSLAPALLALGVAAAGPTRAWRRGGDPAVGPTNGRGRAAALLPPVLVATALGATDVLRGAPLPQRLGHAVTSVLLTGVGAAGALQRRPGPSAPASRLAQAGAVAAGAVLAGGAAVLALRVAVRRAVRTQNRTQPTVH